MKLELSRPVFENTPNIKFRENPSIGSRIPCGRADEPTDMTKLMVAFRNFAVALKNVKESS
jgi:hypothetical protein